MARLRFAFFVGGAIPAQDKYTVQVPDGLAFSEFRGYEDWPVIAIGENGGNFAVKTRAWEETFNVQMEIFSGSVSGRFFRQPWSDVFRRPC
jgi:hypothetical protein